MNSNRLDVLIVDDDPLITELISVNLEAEGYGVRTASDGEKALEAIEQHKPDLVILDIMMPHVDGWEVCRMIKENPDLNSVRVLMLTARDTMKDRMIGQDILKAEEYMTKPFDMNELLDRVRSMCDAG